MSEKSAFSACAEGILLAAEGEAEIGRALGALFVKWGKNVLQWLGQATPKKA
jgi:hypothetical protein